MNEESSNIPLVSGTVLPKRVEANFPEVVCGIISPRGCDGPSPEGPGIAEAGGTQHWSQLLTHATSWAVPSVGDWLIKQDRGNRSREGRAGEVI